MGNYLQRFIKGNQRLIILACIASISFLITEIWRDRIKAQISDLNALAAATDATLQRLAAADSQLSLSRGVFIPESASELLEQAFAAENAKPDEDIQKLLVRANASDDKLNRIAAVYLNDADARSGELSALGMQLSTSSIKLRDMPPLDDFTGSAAKQLMNGCVGIFLDKAPEAIRNAAMAVNPRPLPATFKALNEQFIFMIEEGTHLAKVYVDFRGAILQERRSILAGLTGPEKMHEVQAGLMSINFRSIGIFGACIDTVTRGYSGALINFLRGFRLRLLDLTRPLALKEDRLRYLAYLVAMLAFVATNVKPAKPGDEKPAGTGPQSAGADPARPMDQELASRPSQAGQSTSNDPKPTS